MDSCRCVELVWERWASDRGIDIAPLMKVLHGRKSSETIRAYAPHLDLATEVATLEKMEAEETDGLFRVPGAKELVGNLPPGRWAIVTSGTALVAGARLRLCDITPPPVFVTADDIREGKPAPDCYLMAASRLGIAPARCVVVEDTTAGIEAGKSAGMKVIALTGTCERAALSAADLIASRLADVHIRQTSSGNLSMVVDEMPAEGKHFR